MLNTGDIAFTGFNSDGNDNLAFVALTSIAAGQTIYFSDNEWNGTGWADANESHWSWTASGNIAGGTIVTMDSLGTGTATSSLGTITIPLATGGSNRGVANSDEMVYAYLANSGTPLVPTAFLTAISNDGAVSGSLTGTGLTYGVNALDLAALDVDADVAAFAGTRSGAASFADYRAAINTAANWVSQDATGDQSADGIAPDVPFNATAFTTSGASPSLSINNVTLVEGDSGINNFVFTVTLSQASASTVTVDYSSANGSALAGSDYAAVAGTLTFAPGDLAQTIAVPVNGDTSTEANEAFTVTLSNPANATIATATGNGTIQNDDFSLINIHDIQGAAHSSSLALQNVTTRGIVTAVDSNGFYLQNRDVDADTDIATSEALFVFTNSAPTVSVGQDIQISARVSEFFPGGAGTGNLSTTQLDTVTNITLLSSGNALPTAIILGAAGRPAPTSIIEDDNFASFDASTDGIDYFESLEGMRVTVPTPLAVAPTNSFGEIFTVADGGAGATNLSSRGTANIDGSVGDGLAVTNSGPGSDFNPERIQIDADPQITPGGTPAVSVGAILGDVTGVLSYNFGNYEVIPTEAITVASASTLTPETTTLAGDADTLTVATYNVLNLDPNDSDGDTDVADGRFALIASQIVLNLNTPDIIALSEVQDNSGSVNDGTVSASVTLQMLVNAIAAAGGPTYSYIDSTIVNNTTGGEPGGNIRNAFLYDTSRVTLEIGSVGTTTGAGTAFSGSRPPLVATFDFAGNDITLIGNHFTSKGGSTPLYGTTQLSTNGGAATRLEQAQNVADYVAGLAAGTNVVVLGDLNEFESEESLAPLSSAGLSNLVTQIPEEERYSFLFEGNSQELDHIFVSNALADDSQIDGVHINTEFAVTAASASDHDPLVAAISFNQGYTDVNGIRVYEAEPSLQGSVATPTATDDIVLVRLGSLAGATPGAESIAHENGKIYTTNINGNSVNIQTLGADGSLANAGAIALSGLTGYKPGGVNSVAVKDGIIAVAYENNTAGQGGYVALFSAADNSLIKTIQVGVLPDQITFTPDGGKLLVANEAEAISASNNPVGSISIIDMSGGAAAATVANTIGFDALNGFEATLKAKGLALFSGQAAAADIEPEYISVSPDGTRAYVTLQEVNAVAVIDLTDPAATRPIAIQPLGTVDWSLPGNMFDPTDRDGAGGTAAIGLKNAPVLGLLQPDAIASFTAGGSTYFITANEGDSRVGGLTDSVRLSASSYVLDPTLFPNAAALKADGNIGRLNVLTNIGDTDGDGDFDQIHTLGGRGITIFKQEADGSITKVRETGGEFEAITAALIPGAFNSNQSTAASSFDTRSDDKGPEPEGVTIGVIEGRTYAFVGLERVGGYMVYDVTDPANASFVGYKAQTGADLGPETSAFVSAANSPTGQALLLSAQEISNTTTVYSIQIQSEDDNIINGGADAEKWNGRGGNDVIRGNGGNDTINGGTGSDTARFNGVRADYSITNQGTVISDINLTDGYDGTDTLINVEFLQFSDQTVATSSFAIYTLQLLHFSDGEAGLLASSTAKNLAALADKFEDEFVNSITLASGDIFLPGPFLAGGTDPALIPVINATTGSTIPTTAGTTPAPGVVDTAIHNIIGVEASAIGNHEWDLGSNVFLSSFAPGGGWVGANYALLSANLVFAPAGFPADPVNARFTQTVGVNGLEEASSLKARVAPSAVITENGEKIGLVGATTQILESISSPTGAEILGFPFGPGANGETNNMALLAAQLQPVIDDLRSQGVNKIVLVSHLQQIELEQQLAQLLKGVDIIVAGGSNTRLGDADDVAVAFPGHAADFANTYPIATTDADGKTTLIVNTDSEYTYLGRLVVDFDANGDIVLPSVAANQAVNGAYAATAENVAEAWNTTVENLEATAFANGTRGDRVRDLTDAVQTVIDVKDGNIYGYSNVYLEGERVQVRNQETNLGNVSADANSFAARDALNVGDDTIIVSIKNGGGIRAQIGTIIDNGDGTITKVPPETGGEVSQLDVENALRFDNRLMVFETTAQGLLNILNSPNALNPSNGGFIQIGGVQFSYDPTRPAGQRVRDVALVDGDGNKQVALVNDGQVLSGVPSTISVVALNFTANGGDGYLVKPNADNFRFILNDGTLSAPVDEALSYVDPAVVPSNSLGEQAAFANYFEANFATPAQAYNEADTSQLLDLRIQNQAVRADTVLVGETINGDNFANTLNGGGFNDSLFGFGNRDTLNGGGGDDILNGGSNRDVMIGGAGNDTYFVDNAFDVVTENAGEGIDTVISSVQMTLAANVENGTITGAANIRLSGNALTNSLVGNTGNNRLEGFDGADTIRGGNGNDTIIGGTGLDTLFGEGGADRFVFASLGETGLGANADVIGGFETSLDKIVLNTIDANTLRGGNQAFSFIGDGGFSNVAGQLRSFQDGANTRVAGDINGDGLADFELVLIGNHILTTSDFVL